MRRVPCAVLCSLAVGMALAGCRGSSAVFDVDPETRFSAVILGTRIILPTGETNTGRMAINLEGDRGAEVPDYRLVVPAGRALLYPVEPGVYRLGPTRSIFGWHQPAMRISADHVTYKAPFPSQILRKAPIDIKPKRVVPLGVLETRIISDAANQRTSVAVRLDDSIQARRDVLQQIIHDMASSTTDQAERERDFSWSRCLDMALLELQTEVERKPLYKAPTP
ncbi:MAG: hypothetical protein HY927_03100 [Elusimicrobia bacterium]|nr:hypothetical protein [Elusimicrobiota bacterium]